MKIKRLFMFFPLVLMSLVGCAKENNFVGKGTEDNPYIIKTRVDLIKLSSLSINKVQKYNEAHYRLVQDIDMNGKMLYPIGTTDSNKFTGTFDGQGHTISNYWVASEQTVGLFGYVGEGGYIHDLNVSNKFTTIFNGAMYYGGIVGFLDVGSKVDNCKFIGEVRCNRSNGTTLYFDNNLYIYNLLTNHIANTQSIACGGIAGANAGEITNCEIRGTIAGNIVGGIAGENSGIINNCNIIDSTIYGTKSSGSFVGYLYNRHGQETSIKNTAAYNVSLSSFVFGGGLVGASFGEVEISHCLAYGTHTSGGKLKPKQSVVGDMIGGVLYEQVMDESDVETAKANSINDNVININHNLISFDTSFAGEDVRKLYLHFPYIEEGSTLTATNNISVMRLTRNDVIYNYDKYLRDGYNIYLADDSNIAFAGATSLSTLTKSTVASTLDIDENSIEEVNINGLIGYKY